MTAEIRFYKMFEAMPEKARRELVYDFTGRLMSINVCYQEVKNNTH